MSRCTAVRTFAPVRPTMNITLAPHRKVYFASDQHFGAPDAASSQKREELFIRWLEQIKTDAQVLFLMGDLFDFWHEWKHVIPRGHLPVLAKLLDLKAAGVEIYFFTGNHDLWMRDFFEKEMGIPVFREKIRVQINDQRFLLAHGDGLGPGDKGYKRMKKLFTNPAAQWAFRWLHPDISMRIAQYLSQKNKMISGEEDKAFLGEDREFLILYAKEKLKTEQVDYFVFGHRHLPMILPLQPNSFYVNLGDWITYFTYGEYDGKLFTLNTFS